MLDSQAHWGASPNSNCDHVALTGHRRAYAPEEVGQAASGPHDAGQPCAVGAPAQVGHHDIVEVRIPGMVLGVRCKARPYL